MRLKWKRWALRGLGKVAFGTSVWCLAANVSGADEARAAEFVVSSLADTDGASCGTDCTLRQAINAAKYLEGADTISFAVAGTIRLSGELPRLSGPLTIRNAQDAEVAISGDVNGSGAADEGDVNVFSVIDNAGVTLENLTIRNGYNTLTPTGGGFGGGIDNNGVLSLINCTITSNRSRRGGGGIYNNGGALSMLNCRLEFNSATDNGGALYNDGNLIATGCTFSNNFASSGGGAIFSYPFLNGRTTTLRSCTLSSNAASGGGALNHIGGAALIENCTITANRATFGSGIYATDFYMPTSTIVSNSIVLGNESGTDVSYINEGRNSFLSGGYNLIGGGNAAFNFDQVGDQTSVSDVKLGPLAFNGGPTQTHALQDGSPAINGGDPAIAADATVFDGRGPGFLRVRAGRVDVGAFEVQTDVAPPPIARAVDDRYDLHFSPSQSQAEGVVLQSNGIFRIDAPGVLANDSDSADSPLSAFLETNPKHGRIQLRADGTLFYLPSAGFAGVDEFTYRLYNGFNSVIARVQLNVIDQLVPELRFDTPANGAILKTVSSIRGRVRDRQSGVERVTLLWRRFDGRYWNGSFWTAIVAELPLTVRGLNWIYEGNLPAPGTNSTRDLLDGDYELRVSAGDKSGNFNRITNRITVKNTPTTPPASPSDVRLSSAFARANLGLIQLNFTGALNAASANDKANYRVSVNGVVVKADLAEYTNASIVSLGNFNLEAGDKIILQIADLRDATGKTIAGGTIQVVAR